MNRLGALRYFCAAAETLQFRKAASRLSVSPQVVTRVITELEAALGEPLFVRSTRQVRLTDFGTRFLPCARQFLLDGEKLFATARQKDDEMAGVVRITVPRLPGNGCWLAACVPCCLTTCAARRCKRGGWWSCFPACAARAGACFSIVRSAA